MLKAFYPVPSGAAFAQARRERPEYFAAGVIFGSKGDKLRLPDGREFDCIVAAGGPVSGRSWYCGLIVDDPNAQPDPFPLEPGPLDPLDEDAAIGPALDRDLEALVARGLSDLSGSDDRLAAAGQAVIVVDGAGDIERSYAELVEPALEKHVEIRAALDMDDL